MEKYFRSCLIHLESATEQRGRYVSFRTLSRRLRFSDFVLAFTRISGGAKENVRDGNTRPTANRVRVRRILRKRVLTSAVRYYTENVYYRQFRSYIAKKAFAILSDAKN